MITTIIDALYGIIFLPLILIIIVIKVCKNRKYLHRLNERFACFSWPDHNDIKNHHIDIWIHTVSVGEFISVKPLLSELLRRDPQLKILITATTLTASDLITKYIEQINATAQYRIQHLYYPYDNGMICARFLKKTKPKKAVFFETEIWPKMFKQIKSHNIPLYIINARLSNKSYLNYSKIKFYLKNILNHVDFIAAQSDSDRDRFIKLGCNPKKIAVYGNIKYNIKIPDDIDIFSRKYREILSTQNKLVLIAASTHDGEEEIVLAIYKDLKKKFDNLKLILVPRHPERFNAVYDLCIDKDLVAIKYTDFSNLEQSGAKEFTNNFDVCVLNAMGKLLYFYSISDLAFIGGSMVDVGGHNPIESAILNIPNIIGPNYYNFVTVVQDLQRACNLTVVKDKQELAHTIEVLLSDEDLRKKMAGAAHDMIKSNQEILNNYLNLLSQG